MKRKRKNVPRNIWNRFQRIGSELGLSRKEMSTHYRQLKKEGKIQILRGPWAEVDRQIKRWCEERVKRKRKKGMDADVHLPPPLLPVRHKPLRRRRPKIPLGPGGKRAERGAKKLIESVTKWEVGKSVIQFRQELDELTRRGRCKEMNRLIKAESSKELSSGKYGETFLVQRGRISKGGGGELVIKKEYISSRDPKKEIKVAKVRQEMAIMRRLRDYMQKDPRAVPFFPYTYSSIICSMKTGAHVAFMAMEVLDATLTEMLGDHIMNLDRGTVNWKALDATIFQVICGIIAMQQWGMTHFDLHLDNIMYVMEFPAGSCMDIKVGRQHYYVPLQYGLVKLIDFGFASSISWRLYNKLTVDMLGEKRVKLFDPYHDLILFMESLFFEFKNLTGFMPVRKADALVNTFIKRYGRIVKLGPNLKTVPPGGAKAVQPRDALKYFPQYRTRKPQCTKVITRGELLTL